LVFYTLYWKRSKSLSMALKVPFYIACSDFLLSTSMFPESCKY